jgi:hypothetical protein
MAELGDRLTLVTKKRSPGNIDPASVMATTRKKPAPEPIPGIESVTVQGFKSIRDELTLEFRPLTILCGANSSGKTSILQPLLMMKQTLESPVDPGPLLLWGPHVRFRNTSDFFCAIGGAGDELTVGFRAQLKYSWQQVARPVDVRSTFRREGTEVELVRSRWDEFEIESDLELGSCPPDSYLEWERRSHLEAGFLVAEPAGFLFPARRDRCFVVGHRLLDPLIPRILTTLLHVPGSREPGSRAYPRLAVGPQFAGSFEAYAASVLHAWQREQDSRLQRVEQDLTALGMIDRMEVRPLDATQLEVRVGCRLSSGPGDLVNIADVGIGVSQVLPVVVALQAAEPGTIVYIEQPELHLHPRAQQALAKLLVAAAKRKVRVVVETHSDLLLLGIQTLVAEGEIDPEDVGLHWFHRDDEGVTRMTRAELQPDGSFGEWPEDFGETRMDAEVRFIAAYENRHRPKRRKK